MHRGVADGLDLRFAFPGLGLRQRWGAFTALFLRHPLFCAPLRPRPRSCERAFQSYTLAVNNGANALHGGLVGFDKVIWEPRVYAKEGAVGVSFTYTSHDGEEGFPGNVAVTADYAVTAANELTMTFSATTDKATPINICNHAYWNLSGACERNRSGLLSSSARPPWCCRCLPACITNHQFIFLFAQAPCFQYATSYPVALSLAPFPLAIDRESEAQGLRPHPAPALPLVSPRRFDANPHRGAARGRGHSL